MNSGLVRDAGILAGAALGVQIMFGFKKAPSHPLIDPTLYPLICRSAFLATYVTLAKFCHSHDLQQVLEKSSTFLTLVEQNNTTTHGFEVNRLASEVPSLVEGIVKKHMYDKDMAVAVMAMDFERDELTTISGICDNLVRNMLLDARPYA